MATQIWIEVPGDMGVWVDPTDFEEVDEDTMAKEKAEIDAEAFDAHYAQQAWEAKEALATDGMILWDGDEPPF